MPRKKRKGKPEDPGQNPLTCKVLTVGEESEYLRQYFIGSEQVEHVSSNQASPSEDLTLLELENYDCLVVSRGSDGGRAGQLLRARTIEADGYTPVLVLANHPEGEKSHSYTSPHQVAGDCPTSLGKSDIVWLMRNRSRLHVGTA